MDVRNYCVECDQPKPCDCDETEDFAAGVIIGALAQAAVDIAADYIFFE